jgi:hypothetical protein
MGKPKQGTKKLDLSALVGALFGRPGQCGSLWPWDATGFP